MKLEEIPQIGAQDDIQGVEVGTVVRIRPDGENPDGCIMRVIGNVETGKRELRLCKSHKRRRRGLRKREFTHQDRRADVKLAIKNLAAEQVHLWQAMQQTPSISRYRRYYQAKMHNRQTLHESRVQPMHTVGLQPGTRMHRACGPGKSLMLFAAVQPCSRAAVHADSAYPAGYRLSRSAVDPEAE